MSKKSALFLDIDGCLTSSCGNVCLEYYQAYSKIAELIMASHVGQAPMVALCSGRDRNAVEVMANFLGIVNSWMIVEGGAALYNTTTHEVKLNPCITPVVQKLFRWLKFKKVRAILKRYNCLQEYLGYMICHCLEKKSASLVDTETIIEEIKQNQGRRHKWSMHKLIKKRLLKVRRLGNFIDIIPAGVSKGSCAKFLAEIEDIDLLHSVAIGDSTADFSLFRRVGMIGCPCNATQECIEFVKRHKGKASIYPYAKGVLDVINWYLGRTED